MQGTRVTARGNKKKVQNNKAKPFAITTARKDKNPPIQTENQRAGA